MQHQTYQMAIDGMTCDHCERSVEQALTRSGATDVKASFHQAKATFRLPASVAPSDLSASVRAAGYDPGNLEPIQIDDIRPRLRSSSYDYDLAIIGSGSGAFAAAIRAIDLGARVVMIERDTVGGTCVNIGCVPSKLLLRAGESYHHAGHQPYNGVQTAAKNVDFGDLARQKRQLVNEMRQSKYVNLIEQYGWDLIQGEARFLDPETIEVNGRTITAAAYILATGARPSIPPIPGLENAGYLTSTTAMELEHLPASLAIIGAGYIALEQGQVFRHLGSEVTLLQRSKQILSDYDPEISDAARAMLDRIGTRLETNVQITRVDSTPSGRRIVYLQHGREHVLDVEQVLVAAGRTPNVDVLNLAAAEIELTDRGAPRVDDSLRTTNPKVWAVGDVTLSPQFVYVAAYEGGLAAENALTVASRTVDLRAVPSVIFTEPQIASVGMTSAEAEDRGHTVKTAVLPGSAVPRSQVNYEHEGTFILVADADTDQVLGAQVVASNAGDVIYAATLAVKYRMTVTDLTESFAPYLTMAEGLKLAALSFDRDVAMLSCCAA